MASGEFLRLRAQINRRKRNQRIAIIGVVVVVAAALVIGAYYLSTLSTPGSAQIGKPVSSSDYQALYKVSQTAFGNTNQTLMDRVTSVTGQPYTSNGKPIIVYIGADYCPYCAFQRWPLVLALMRFGNFTNLAYMESSSTDVYPDSPTFSFHGSSYTSKYIVFEGFEQEDRNQNPLDTVPGNYTTVFSQFGSSYPFININDQYVITGAFYFPDQLDGKNWTQITQLLSTNSIVSNEVVTSANAITAAICKVTPNAPSSVCGNSSISGLTLLLTAYRPPSVASPPASAQLDSSTSWSELRFLATFYGSRTSG